MVNIETIQCAEMRAAISKELDELRKQASFAEQLNDGSIDQIISYDRDKIITTCNKTFADNWGLHKAELVGKPILQALPVLKQNKDIEKAIDTALAGFKIFVPADKGSYNGGYYEHHFIPIKDDNDNVTDILIIIHDVAHRIKAEEELKRLNRSLAKKNDELEVLNDEILAFSSVAGNDLKEPLRKIYNFIEIILRDDFKNLSDKSRSNFRRMQAAAQRMGLLTDDIYAFSMLNVGYQHKENVNLNHTLVVAKACLQQQINQKTAIIKAEPLPDIWGYRQLLTKMFSIIISNGIKFQPEDNVAEIKITSSIMHGSDIPHTAALIDLTYHVIHFKDNGIGFEDKDAEVIFKLFKKLNPSATNSGTGVGLSICRKICELHNGFVVANSIKGEGSVFSCYLPVVL